MIEGPAQKSELPEDFIALSSALQSRRSAEAQGGAINERTQKLLDALADGSFARWRQMGVAMSVWADANGLRIDAGPTGARGVHSHIPYQYITPELATQLGNSLLLIDDLARYHMYESWLEQKDVPPRICPELGEEYPGELLLSARAAQLEFETRVAEAHARSDLLPNLYAMQNLTFAAAARHGHMDPREKDLPLRASRSESDAIRYLFVYTDAVVGEINKPWSSVEFHLPRSTIERYITTSPDPEDTKTNYWENAPIDYRIDKLLTVLDAANAAPNEYTINEFTKAEPRSRQWAELRNSHKPAVFSKAVFEARRQALHENHHNAEVSKVLTILLETYSPPELAAHGIQMARAAFNKDLEFVGFWGHHGYHHILIDPQKHIRSQKAQSNYDSTPSISRSDYEAFEGLLLPYTHFRRLAREVTIIVKIYGKSKVHLDGDYYSIVAKNLQNAIEGSLSVISTEIHPNQLRELSVRTKEALSGLQKQPTEWTGLERLSEYLNQLLKEYDGVFVGRSAQDIIDERLPSPERFEVTFDDQFLAAMPEVIRTKGGFDEGLCRCGVTTTVIRSGSSEHAIPYALEAKALRALKVTRGPTLLSITGAKYAKVEGEQEQEIERMAAAEMMVLAKWNGNMFMQGTNSGKIAAAKVRAFQTILQRTDTEVNQPQLIGIEPGRELFFPNNDLLDTTTLSSTHPILPIKMIITPYHAGWSNLTDDENAQLQGLNEEQKSKHLVDQYLEHIEIRQGIIRRASEGYPKVVSIINGGGWSVPEAIAALKDGFELITVCNQGRLGTLLCHLHQHKNDWHHLTNESEIISYVQSSVDALHESDRFKTGIIEVLPTLKKRGLVELLQLMKDARVRTATLETYADTLDAAFNDQTKQYSE